MGLITPDAADFCMTCGSKLAQPEATEEPTYPYTAPLKPVRHSSVIVPVLLMLLILTTGILFYIHTFKVSSLEDRLTKARAEIDNLQKRLNEANAELDATRSKLSSAQDELKITRDKLADAEGLLEGYKARELRNPTRRELIEFLRKDDTDEIEYYQFFEYEKLTYRLKENSIEARIKTAIVVIDSLECRIDHKLYKNQYTIVLGSELDDGSRVYFSIENDELYDSAEKLISSWEGYSNVKVHKEIWYWC